MSLETAIRVFCASAPLTPEALDRLEKVAMAATPGPWRHNRNARTNSVGTANNDAGHVQNGHAVCLCQLTVDASLGTRLGVFCAGKVDCGSVHLDKQHKPGPNLREA